MQSILRSFKFRNDSFLYRKFNLPPTLFNTLEAMDSPERLSSRMHPKYVILLHWEILVSSLLMSSLSNVFKRLLEPNTIVLVLSSPKWILNLFSTNQSHNELKFLFKLLSAFFQFSPVYYVRTAIKLLITTVNQWWN